MARCYYFGNNSTRRIQDIARSWLEWQTTRVL